MCHPAQLTRIRELGAEGWNHNQSGDPCGNPVSVIDQVDGGALHERASRLTVDSPFIPEVLAKNQGGQGICSVQRYRWPRYSG